MQRSASTASVSSSGAIRCRLCWGDETEQDGGSPLVSPCNCRGSVGYIHVHCLQHWLEVKRQQCVSRNRAVRCEVCNAKYKASRIPRAPGSAPLLPNLWNDPYGIAGLLHGAWRAYVVGSGMYYAFTIYASINKGIGGQQLVRPRTLGRRLAGSSTSSSSAALGAGGSSISPVAVGPVQPLRHHLSLTLPVAGAGAGRADGSLLHTIRERFDKATMVQVYWYTGLMGLMPTPPNADAFAGMAVGATVGGMVAQLVFLPMLGSGKWSALVCSGRLLLKCMVRLLLAEACQAKGFRALAGVVKGAMQRWQRWGQRRRQRNPQRVRQRAVPAPPWP